MFNCRIEHFRHAGSPSWVWNIHTISYPRHTYSYYFILWDSVGQHRDRLNIENKRICLDCPTSVPLSHPSTRDSLGHLWDNVNNERRATNDEPINFQRAWQIEPHFKCDTSVTIDITYVVFTVNKYFPRQYPINLLTLITLSSYGRRRGRFCRSLFRIGGSSFVAWWV